MEAALTDAMRALRETSYKDCLCTADEFDVDSCHVTAWMDAAPVGMVRLTPGRSMLQASFAEPVDLFQGDGVIEMNRGIVRDDLRMLGVHGLLVVESMMHAARMGFATAVAAVEPDKPTMPLLRRLGFRSHGRPAMFRNPTRVEQPIVADLVVSARRLPALRAGCLARMAARGIRAETDIERTSGWPSPGREMHTHS
jgi:hypothetical protein